MKKRPIEVKDEKTAKALTEKDLAVLRRHVEKAFAHVWSLSLLAGKDTLGELGEEEAYLILSEASLELEQAKTLLDEEAEKRKAA